MPFASSQFIAMPSEPTASRETCGQKVLHFADRNVTMAHLLRRGSGAITALLAALTLLAGCGGEAQPVRAALLASVSPAHCLQAIAADASIDPVRCPAPLRDAIMEATTVCREAGGTLQGSPEGTVWVIDVNGDGRQELAFELDGNVSCVDAWSVFSCGSLGCPKTLYELRSGAWVAIGGILASEPEQLMLGTIAASDGHRVLEVCAQEDCAERWIYEWLGTAYDSTRVEVRGARVDVASSIHGLYPLATQTQLRALPSEDSAEVGQYDAGTEVAIVGTAAGGAWYYVSPCNACPSGFAPLSAVSVP